MAGIRSAAVAASLVALSACGSGAAGGGGGASASTPALQTPVTHAAPALVQVENSPDARPQTGLGSADVVYEYLTEGGISRFSAILLHPAGSTRVGPVRSARLVSIALTELYGAVLVYSGSSAYVRQQIQQSSIPRFDETAAQGDMFRVNDRYAPHNLYTDTGRLADLVHRAGAPQVSWQLWPRTAAAAGGTPVAAFRVPISFAETPVWTYGAAAGGYTRREPDTGPFLDAATGRPVVAPTVIVQQVTVSQAPEIEDVNGAHGVEQDVRSGGAAQIFTGGRELDATWSQPQSGPPVFTLKDGTPAPIAPGLVWIELVPTGSPATPA